MVCVVYNLLYYISDIVWYIDEVSVFLENMKLEEYYDMFINNNIKTIKSLQKISNKELQKIGIQKKFHRRKIMENINKL